MAAGSFIQVTNGSGPKVSTGATYTENSNVVQDQKVIIGEPYLASYAIAPGTSSLLTNANVHALEIMAGASLNVRLRRLVVYMHTLPGTANFLGIELWRLTTAGTGGTAVTPAPLNPADSASGATAMVVPTAGGTESTRLWSALVMLPQAVSTTMPWPPLIDLDFDEMERTGPIIIAAGTTNGLALKTTVAFSGAAIRVNALITETSF